MMRRLFVLGALALTLVSCKSLPFPEPDYQGEYGEALKKWTRKTTLYSGLETRAFVRVVYMSEEFVAAQAAEISAIRAELPEQAAETLAKMREQYKAPTVFAVVYIPDPHANDWDLPDSVWRIALNLGLGERAPDRIERFDRPFNAELKRLYPYLDEYSVAYRIRFPEPEPAVQESNITRATQPAQQQQQQPAAAKPAQPFRPTDAYLVVAGALGQMTFHWSLDGHGDDGVKTGTKPESKRPESPKPP